MEPNAYAFSIGGGVAYACPACYLDSITSAPDPDADIDFNPVTLPLEASGQFCETCEGCGIPLPEKED